MLIVEDNDDNRFIYTTYLEHAGIRVLQAADGATGLATAKEESPDLILMDVSLPIIDGLEATRLLKADVQTRTMPILILTAHAMPSDREAALDAGADGYLAKPIEPGAVLDAVLKVLAREA